MGLEEIDRLVKKKKVTVSITLDPDINDEFTRVAKHLGVAKSKIVEKLIELYLESKKNLFNE